MQVAFAAAPKNASALWPIDRHGWRQQQGGMKQALTQQDTQAGGRRCKLSSALSLIGDLMIPDDRVMKALSRSPLTEDLGDDEIVILASEISVRYFEVNEIVMDHQDDALKDSLMILIEGDVEVNALVGAEPVSLRLTAPGDLARILSFVGGGRMHVSTKIRINKASAMLLLQRSGLESLLNSHPFIVYCVMRNLVRHVHGLARRKDAEKEVMTNYIYGIHGRY
jgi:CRP/FNR family cyclic AMP-dependent transcriptional regulator